MSSETVSDPVVPARLIGGVRWSSRGTYLHLVPNLTKENALTAKALCGTKPRGRSHGWAPHSPNADAVCPRCKAKAP